MRRRFGRSICCRDGFDLVVLVSALLEIVGVLEVTHRRELLEKVRMRVEERLVVEVEERLVVEVEDHFEVEV